MNWSFGHLANYIKNLIESWCPGRGVSSFPVIGGNQIRVSLCLLCWCSHSRDIFYVEGFPYKDQIQELLIVIVLFYVFPTCNIVNFLINFTFFNCNMFFKGTI